MKRVNILLLQSCMSIAMSCIITVLIIFSETSIFAQMADDKLDELFKKLEENDKKVNTIMVDYVQIVSFESTKEKQEVWGTLFFKRPCSVYINQKTPREQQIYFDGKNVTVYTLEFEQAVIDSLNNGVNKNSTLATILNFVGFWKNLKEVKKTNTINFVEENEKYILIKISPIVKNNYDSMKICISKATMYPNRAVLESNGIKIKIVFKNYLINSSLDKNIFRFNAPKGVEVIKLN
jgi:chaperone LolA